MKLFLTIASFFILSAAHSQERKIDSSLKTNQKSLDSVAPKFNGTVCAHTYNKRYRRTHLALVFVDGKKVRSRKLKRIDPNSIQEVTVLNTPEKLKEYGKAGRNGVILITLKKQPTT